MHVAHSGKAKRKRGFILVLALFFLMVLGFMGTALVGLLPMEFRSSSRNQLDAQAHYAAAAGIRYANHWMYAVVTDGSTENDPELQYLKLGDRIDDATKPWGNAEMGAGDIMGVPSSNPDWGRMRLSELQFPAAGYPYIPPSGGRPFERTSLGLCGYSGDGAPDPSLTYVVATKRPIQIGDDWSVWVAFVPHNDFYTPGSAQASLNNNLITDPRAYQLVSVAFYQGQPYLRAKAIIREESASKTNRGMATIPPPDNSAAGAGLYNQEFVLGANTPNQVLYEGPVHSNQWLPMSVAAPVWGSTQQAFQGIVSFSQNPPVDAGWDQDGVLWAAGNYGAFNDDRRPFAGLNDNTPLPASAGLNRYEALIKNGKSFLQKGKTKSFNPDSAQLYGRAFGVDKAPSIHTQQVSGPYLTPGQIPVGAFGNITNTDGTPQVVTEIVLNSSGQPVTQSVPKKPQGLFVATDGTKPLGGVFVNGDVKAMMLEVVDSTGNPVLSTNVLATASQGAYNSAIRVQDQALSAREIPIITASTSSTFVPTGTTFTTATSTQMTSQINSTTFTTTTQNVPILATTVVPVTQQVPTFATTFTTNQIPTTITSISTGSQYVSNANGSGSAGWIPSFTTTFTPGPNSQQVTSNVSSTGTSQQVTSSNSVSTTGTTQQLTVNPQYGYGPPTPTPTVSTSSQVVGTTQLTTQVSTTTQFETWQAIDRLIIPDIDGAGVTVPPVLNFSSTNYQRPAGRSSGSYQSTQTSGGNNRSPSGGGNSFLMDTAKAASMQVYFEGAALTGPLTVSAGEMVVIKQSRLDPNVAYAFKVPKDPVPSAGTPERERYNALHPDGGTNGLVYVQGNVNGVAGVNKDRRTIVAQNDNLAQREVDIADNIIEYRTPVGQKPTVPNNGLGIMANNVNLVARNNQFNDNLDSDPLRVYAVVIAGRTDTDHPELGGLRIKANVDARRTYLTRHDVGNGEATIGTQTVGQQGNSARDNFLAGLRLMKLSDIQFYNNNLHRINDRRNAANTAAIRSDMNYLIGLYRNWTGANQTPFFRLFGGLMEAQPGIIFNGNPANTAGYKSSFIYNAPLQTAATGRGLPGMPNSGTVEVVSYQEERI